MRARISFFACLIIMAFVACNSGGTRNETAHVTGSDTLNKAAIPMEDTVTVMTREEAETLVAIHYSKLNRETKYQLYQGLLVAIDSISRPSQDTVQIHSTIHGRKWLTPNGDTTTLPFREIKALSAWRKDGQWNSD
jgi:hypothetical protein